MNQNPNHPSQEEALTRFIDGEATAPQASLPQAWLTEKAAAQHVGNLLRAHLPARQEPPSEEFFVSQLMQKIAAENPQPAPVANAVESSFWSRFRIWLAPMATAAALLVVGGILLNKQHSEGATTLAYTPLPNVQATLTTHDYATVINLTGLDDIPDTHEIKAYNVTTPSSKTARRDSDPGAPQRFYAAGDPDKLLFVMFPANGGAPTFHEVN